MKVGRSKGILLLIILVEGFVTISVEILTIRQLLPVVGNSVVVTSLIIGIFLLFLAYGYRRGGQYEGDFKEILKNNFTKSAIWLGVGLSYFFIAAFFEVFQNHISQTALLNLTLYLLFITAPVVYLLGQTIPITMNLVQKENTLGAVGGNILHLSTLGSFLGAILTSLILMNYLGVAWTVFINFCLLCFLTFILFSNIYVDITRIVLLSVFGVLVYGLNVYIENKSFIATNMYANYEILTNEETKNRLLVMNESSSALLTPNKEGYPYIEVIKKILFKELKLRNKEILALGAGGFTLTAESDFDNIVTYVDIDENIKSIVQKFFSDSVAGEFVVKDARAYLNTSEKQFDVIVSDAYSNRRTIPTHLLTLEFFKLVKNHLKDTGIAIFNVVARPTLEDAYSRRVDYTLRFVFPGCMVIPINYSGEVGNIIYVCRKQKDSLENVLYTDNLNKATLDYFDSISTIGRNSK